jgi:hypothetical protein
MSLPASFLEPAELSHLSSAEENHRHSELYWPSREMQSGELLGDCATPRDLELIFADGRQLAPAWWFCKQNNSVVVLLLPSSAATKHLTSVTAAIGWEVFSPCQCLQQSN